MKTLLRRPTKPLRQEPLLLFLIVGLALFASHRVFSNATGIDNPRVIDVDEPALLRFTQFRSKVFSEEGAARVWATMPLAEKKSILNQFIREEALYREAREWGLDQDDYVIRRRLVQSLEFALSGEGAEPVKLDEAQLREFYAAHPDLYRQGAAITFTHMFFSKDKGGMAEAEARARAALTLVQQGRIDPVETGDRFLYLANYASQGADTISSQFGSAAEKALFALKPSPEWQGPIVSDHGVHLVRIMALDPGGLPPFEAVREKVASDAAVAERSRIQEEAVQRIIGSYRLRFAPEFEALK